MIPTGHRLLTAIVGGGAIGALVLGFALYSQRRAEATETPSVIATEEYGRRLITDTARLLGPDHEDPAMRYSGSRLACSSCHLGSGVDPGMLSLLESADLYPRYSGRDGGERDLFDRINGCMERSMNGRTMPRNSPELIAMVNYVESLGDRFKAMGTSLRQATDPAAFVRPERAVNFTAGEQVFKERCAICHSADGLGLRASADAAGRLRLPAALGTGQLQRWRRHGARAHRGPFHQGADAARRAHADK